MGSKVWTKYGIGSMNQARSGTGIDSILSIYARMSPQECMGLHSWCPTSTSTLATDSFSLDEWAIWTSVRGAPAKTRFSLARAAQ